MINKWYYKGGITIDNKIIKKSNIETYLNDPVFIALVKKYAKESEKFNKVDKEHDKIFKSIFSKKSETAKLLTRVTGIKINASDIVSSQNSFVTTELKYREADIIYKLKDKNVVFLIEHQTKVDYKMPYRIVNYQIESMRVNEANKNEKECLVIAIVIFTGKGTWTAKRYIEEIQEKFFNEDFTTTPHLGTLGFYNLVDINDYTKDELMKDNSLLSKIMLIEKERNTKDLISTMFEINERIKNNKNKEIVYDAMASGLSKKFGPKLTKQIMKKIIEKGSDNMLAVEEMVLEENRMLRKQGISEGKKIGINEGRKLGITEGKRLGIRANVINMLKMNFPIKTISEISELSEKEIEEIKEELDKN